jgi:hypothetical protein
LRWRRFYLEGRLFLLEATELATCQGQGNVSPSSLLLLLLLLYIGVYLRLLLMPMIG